MAAIISDSVHADALSLNHRLSRTLTDPNSGWERQDYVDVTRYRDTSLNHLGTDFSISLQHRFQPYH